ncbi:MAG: glycosyl transferase, partial [Bacilli bacterium]|nr:glycosyl transferase [Bacilli bacterium]
HNSGGLYICKNKAKAISDWQNIKEKLEKSLKTNYYKLGREWPYKNVPRKVLAEMLLETESEEISDYKFFCFDGKPEFLFVATERQKLGVDVKFDFFDLDFNWLPIKQGHENAAVKPSKPSNFEEMVKIVTTLSKGLRHARIDLYNVNGKIYFGEITFFNHSGFLPFNPPEWDVKFGNMLKLP